MEEIMEKKFHPIAISNLQTGTAYDRSVVMLVGPPLYNFKTK
jgi:hypothetical protein